MAPCALSWVFYIFLIPFNGFWNISCVLANPLGMCKWVLTDPSHSWILRMRWDESKIKILLCYLPTRSGVYKVYSGILKTSQNTTSTNWLIHHFFNSCSILDKTSRKWKNGLRRCDGVIIDDACNSLKHQWHSDLMNKKRKNKGCIYGNEIWYNFYMLYLICSGVWKLEMSLP